ncbi:MAG TPA: carbohydrate porin [Xanthobacteraceae bacterium]|nr:carbohydrate porin [Xanthobacteraceae bacterium]
MGYGIAGRDSAVRLTSYLALVGVSAFGAAVTPAAATDLPAATAKAPTKAAWHDWSGFYFGGHVGYGLGHADATVWDPSATARANRFDGLTAGVQFGYNWVLPSRLLLGLETDLTFPSFLESNAIVAALATAHSDVTEQLDYAGTVRGRLGYVADSWMIYVTGGYAFAGTRILNQLPTGDEEKTLNVRSGWALGAGVGLALSPHWSTRLEYIYHQYDGANVQFPSGTRYASSMDFHELRVGLDRKLGEAGHAAADTTVGTESDRWELHAQTTYIQQGYPSFRSPYQGPNSLSPLAQTRETWTNSAFVGVRLWDGGELYYNPELLQGFGLSDSVGLAGFPNGEAQKSDFAYPHYNTSRLALRQIFGFGGEQESIESAPNQLSGKLDVSRLTLQVGRFAVSDYFDNNSYARDPRRDFMNGSIWASGAFDYAADKVGYTYGGVAELNQKDWALRAGYFLIDKVSNSNAFDTKFFQRGEYVVELEERYALFSHPGKLRMTSWVNSAFAGSYRETLDNPTLNLDIAQTRKGRIKYGYIVNLEQSIADDLGVFGRWSWNEGRTEIMAFTDIDRSLSGGVSIKGKRWGRPDDTVAVAGAVNALSRDHRDFIAAGGLGINIGDGRLNYQTERILETYYSYALLKTTSLTFDYQLVVNPAYNADRGPVSIFAVRLHADF